LLILHQFYEPPFADKVRITFGFKDLAPRSIRVA
jgi:hypothetical protein